MASATRPCDPFGMPSKLPKPPALRGPGLPFIRRKAEGLAGGRHVTTGHLLAAIASTRSLAATTLKERRLDAEVLLQAARVLTDGRPDAAERAVQRAHQLAAGSHSRKPGGAHLLSVLCDERGTAAFRAILQCGYEPRKLGAAMQHIATAPAALTQGAGPTTTPHGLGCIPPRVLRGFDD